MSNNINGLILAGGKSSRMGHDKSLISFHGKPQREYLFELLSQCCTKVYTSCKNGDDVPTTLNPLHDQYSIESPMNGILSAFTLNPEAAWLTVPVDMPSIDIKTLQHLISNRSEKRIATCYYDSEEINPEPLLALWESDAFPLLLQFYRAGKISPRDFLKQGNVNIISIPDVRALRNINSKDELDRFLSNDDYSS